MKTDEQVKKEISDFYKLYSEFRHKRNSFFVSEYQIKCLVLGYTMSDKASKLLGKEFKKAAKDFERPGFEKPWSRLLHSYAPVLGSPKEKRKVSELLQKLNESSEEVFIDYAVKRYSNPEKIGSFYQAYMCYMHLNKGVTGLAARNDVCRNIYLGLMNEDNSKIQHWIKSLPKGPGKLLEQYLT